MYTSIYLDNAATTPLRESVKEYIMGLLDMYGNPSSSYTIGEQTRTEIENARKNVAKFINADSKEVYFTGSGSASNVLAIRGYCDKNNCRILYSPTLHKSALECIKARTRTHIASLKVDNEGFIDINDLREMLSISTRKALVVVDYANSEIGTIQNIKEIIDMVHFYNGIIYLDCTGSIPTIPLDVKELDVDMCGFSAHKLGSLKGTGVLYKKTNVELEPLIYGSQEHGLIGGTENVLGICSLGKAIENYNYNMTSHSRDYMWNKISKEIPSTYLVGTQDGDCRLINNLYVCFKGVQGESLMIMLDMLNVYVSTGSACNTGNLTAHPTLSAIRMDKEDINSCIRMTFSCHETDSELDTVCSDLCRCVSQLRELNGIKIS